MNNVNYVLRETSEGVYSIDKEILDKKNGLVSREVLSSGNSFSKISMKELKDIFESSVSEFQQKSLNENIKDEELVNIIRDKYRSLCNNSEEDNDFLGGIEDSIENFERKEKEEFIKEILKDKECGVIISVYDLESGDLFDKDGFREFEAYIFNKKKFENEFGISIEIFNTEDHSESLLKMLDSGVISVLGKTKLLLNRNDMSLYDFNKEKINLDYGIMDQDVDQDSDDK